jgi:hypothetical protein
MPRIRRRHLPEPLLRHLLRRVRERGIAVHQLLLVRDWLRTEPEVPPGPWYKSFEGLTVCGEGELVKTFLLPGQAASGTKL